MADDVLVNTGTSISGATNKTLAADDIAGVLYPRTKIVIGADGVNGGDVSSANPLPVSGAVTVSGVATAANQTTGNTSLSSIDGKLPTLSAGKVPVDPGTVTVTGSVTTGGLTDTQLRATPVPVSGTVTATTGGLTDAQLRASAVPVSGPLTDTQLRATALPVSGPLTDAQLRATAVPISAASLPLPSGAATDGAAITGATMPTGGSGLFGWLSAIWKAITDRLPAALVGGRLDVNVGNTVTVSGAVTATTGGLTDTQLRATAVPVSGPLTDAQIRATPLPISGTVSTGGLTDTQLRATAVPISASALPLPSGAATAANQATEISSLSNIDTKTPALVTGRVPVDGSGVTQPISGNVGVTGSVAVTGPLTDAQLRATAVPVSGPLTDTQIRATALPVSAASLPLPTGAATSAAQTTGNSSLSSIDGKLPALSGGSVPVTGVLTDTQLRASAVGVTVASTNLTPTRSVATTSSTVSAGAQCVGFKNTGTTTVTLLGQNLLAGESRALSVPYPFKLAAIAYNATGGTLEILEVR